MFDIIYIAFLWLVVTYADWRMTAHNWGAKWNGIGCVDDVLTGTAMLPMQRRVLVPWFCGMFDKQSRLGAYTILRQGSILFALIASYVYFGYSLIGVSLLAAFFVLAAIYDYTDVYLEVGFFSLVLYCLWIGNLVSIIVIPVIIFLAVLNRETAVVLVPIVFWSADSIVVPLAVVAGLAGLLLPFAMYRNAKRYCPFNMVKENITRMKQALATKPILYNEYFNFLILTIATVSLYTWTALTVGLSVSDIWLGILYVALIVPSVWMEIRVFAPTMLAVIPMAMRGL